MVDVRDIVEQLRNEEQLGLLEYNKYLGTMQDIEATSIFSSFMNSDEMNEVSSNRELGSDSLIPSIIRHEDDLDDSFHLIADRVSDFISITTFSIKPVYTYVNHSFTKYLGYDKNELIGQNSLDMIHPDDLKKLRPILKKYIGIKAKNILKKEKQSFSETFECRIRDKSGKWHIFSSTANSFGDQILFIAKDITEKQLEHERYRIISKISTDIIYEWDIKNGTLDWIGDIDKELGYESGEIERTIAGWVSLIHPEDQERLKDAVQHHMQATNPIFEEYRIKHKNGTWRYWRDKAAPVLNNEGKPVKWIGGCTDITLEIQRGKRIKQEKQFIDSILKSLPGVFYLFDEHGHFLQWNKNFEKITEYSSEEIDTMTPIDLFGGADKEKIAQSIKTSFETGYVDVEASFLTKSGKQIPFFLTGVNTHYNDQSLLVGVGINLSKMKQIEDELNIRIKELETFEKLAVNREIKMIQLKKEINMMLKKQGRKEKYEINET